MTETQIQKTDETKSTQGQALQDRWQEAKWLQAADLLPTQYRGDEGIPNLMIVIDVAKQMGVDPFSIVRNLHVIQGKPSFSSTFLISSVNASGKFSPIRYRMQGEEGKPSWGCRAYATDRESGEECVGPAVTMAMAEAEGWLSKRGSKWITMPELMMQYRAAAFWQRLFCPEITSGFHTTDEVQDMQTPYRAEVITREGQSTMDALTESLEKKQQDNNAEATLIDEPVDDDEYHGADGE